MNKLFNTPSTMDAANQMYAATKKNLMAKPESLFSMALYDFDPSLNHHHHQLEVPGAAAATAAVAPTTTVPAMASVVRNSSSAIFHPVDEYKDLSLREILDLSDDFLFGDDEQAPKANDLEPVPLPAVFERPNQAVTSKVTSTEVLPEVKQIPQESVVVVPPQPSIPEPKPLPVVSAASSSSSSSSSEAPSDNSDASSKKKRRRESSLQENDHEAAGGGGEDGARGRRFRPYQAGQWADKFEELCNFKDTVGHCLVPHTYKQNLPLARWVKRQRYQYKLMLEGKASTMTLERAKALENIGFVWDSQGAAWGDRLNELREFRDVFMHCNVPSNYNENPQLATWVKCQRRQHKLYLEGKPSNMTPERISLLEGLGFEWELRSYKKMRTC